MVSFVSRGLNGGENASKTLETVNQGGSFMSDGLTVTCKWHGQRNPGIGTVPLTAVLMLRFQSPGIWREGATGGIH